jgi:pimeloyl-ACP methyl ester carboxylesterase
VHVHAQAHDEHPVAWLEAGNGPTVVFLHGLGGTRLAWGPQLDALSDRFRCVAWDMPGYGGSAPLLPLSYAGIAERLRVLLDRLEVERAHLVGLSFGGMHALHFTLAHPERVGRLVLASTSPAFGMDGTRAEDWMADRLRPIDAGGRPSDGAERVIDAITARPLVGTARTETLASFDRISPEGFRAAVTCLPTNDHRDRLATIQAPALVIVGELDRETPVSYARVLADGLPDARLEILAGVGHLTPTEAPDAFNRLVAEFLPSTTSEKPTP